MAELIETIVHKVIQIPDLRYKYTAKIEFTVGNRKVTAKAEGDDMNEVLLKLARMEELLRLEPDEIRAVLKE